ncbi:MAG TPA: hypothetical protein VGE07_01345, partial [Herpetosiphonaceae bacterium]
MTANDSFSPADPLVHIGFMTLNVSRPGDPRRDAWLDQLAAYRVNAAANPGLVGFLDACAALIHANGDPAGLGTELNGRFAQI